MKFLLNLCKGTIAGIGGIAPGLSGSVLLVILGLYEDAVNAIGTLFQNFKKNVIFLLPLVLGFGCGVLLFSKVVDFMLVQYEFYTRYAFLGLVLGTIPLFYQEVRKKGFSKRYYLVILGSAAIGFFLFGFNKTMFPVITEPNLFQSVLLGVMVAGSSIIPGIDSAVILSALGLYELYVSSLASFNLQVLLPAALGLVLGALGFSAIMHILLKKCYTLTFSVIFGLFLSIIPDVLNESCTITSASQGIYALLCAVLGCLLSYYLGDIKGNNARLRRLFGKKK